MESLTPRPLEHEVSAKFLQRNLVDETIPVTVPNLVRLAAHYQAAGLFDEAVLCENLAASRAANKASRFLFRHTPAANLASRLVSEAFRISCSHAPRAKFREFLHRTGLTPSELEEIFFTRCGRTHANYHLAAYLTQADGDF